MFEWFIIGVLLVIIIILCNKKQDKKGNVVVHKTPEFTKTRPAPPPRFIENKKQIIEIKSEYIAGIRGCHINVPTKIIVRELCEGICDELLKNNAISVKSVGIGDGLIQHEASLFIVKENDNG